MRLNYFNFKEFNGKMLLTNDLGKYIFVEKSDFKRLVSGEIDVSSQVGKELIETKMIYNDTDLSFSEENEYMLRNVKGYAAIATSLHIFVVTTACNMNCVYCQANNGTTCPDSYMNNETAERAVDIALQSPETYLTFEFQGGEPLLNYSVIRHIVEYAEKNKKTHHIEYNIVSNLTVLTDEMVEFFSEYSFGISTSVDGMEEVHNTNRPFKNGKGTFDIVSEKIQIIKSCGLNIGAIETTTALGLGHAKELVRTYADLGFDSIFIRHLTQLGKANKVWDKVGYSADDFLSFYREALDEIIRLNKKGIYMQEQHAAIFLKSIRGKHMNYMELRSPCGAGIGQLAYFSDGRIFTCDEGRMLAEMGNDSFMLGNVYKDTYQSIMKSGVCRTVCSASMLETIPSCCDCVYQPYCGTCPVVNYAISDDVLEKTPRSYRCQIYEGILDYIFEMLFKQDRDIMDILSRWSE